MSGRKSIWHEHEVLDDTVEFGTLVAKSKVFAILVLAGSKSAEVLDSFGHGLRLE